MKSQQILVLLVLLALNGCLSTQTKSRVKNMQKQKDKLKYNNKRFEKMPILDVIRIIHKDQEYMDNQNTAAAKAEALFQQKQQGRDDSGKALSNGTVFVRTLFKFVQPGEDDRVDLQEKPYIMNDKYLYFLDAPDSYRSVSQGIDLAQVVSRADDCNAGACCQRVQEIQHVEIATYEFEGFCFHLDLPTENYLFCKKEQSETIKFKNELVQAIMNAWFIKQGIQAPMFAEDLALACLNPIFSWKPSEISEWPCECSRGTKQSPIEIDESIAIQKEDHQIRFTFQDPKGMMYGLVRRQPEFYAEFGYFSHISPKQTKKFFINKISFKYQNEHKVNGTVEGEVMIYGVSESGEKAIVSVILESGKDDNAANGQTFFDAMNIELWNFAGVENIMDDNGVPKLKCFPYMEKGTNQFYPNLILLFQSKKMLKDYASFYWYQGSDSRPPCEEGITRYIMKHPARINPLSSASLKKKIITEKDKMVQSKTNTRPLQQEFGRQVYYHEACFNPNAKKPIQPEPTDTDYKFVKATQQYKIYAVADEKFDIKNTFIQHSLKADTASKTAANPYLIQVNPKLSITRYPGYKSFKKDSGSDTIQNLKRKWLEKYQSFPEPTVFEVSQEEKLMTQQLEEAKKKAELDAKKKKQQQQ